MKTEPAKPETKALAQVEAGTRGLVLNNLQDMQTVSQIILQSHLAPDSYQSSEQIFVGLQAGAEIGLKPLQALNSIVVMKGKPTLWGDAALALVKRSGLCEYCKEYFEKAGEKISEKDIQYAKLEDYPDDLIAVCETKAKRDTEPIIRYFSVADAKLAGLWGRKSKQGRPMPWCTHPKRMLKYKARAFNLRDNFPDVLFGMHLTEEMIGEEPLQAPESDVPPRDERRLAVPSSTVDTTRASVQEAREEVVQTLEKLTDAVLGPKPDAEAAAGEKAPEAPPEGSDSTYIPLGVKTEPVIEGKEPSQTPVQEAEEKKTPTYKGMPLVNEPPLSDESEEPKPESGLVTFQCPKCLRTYQYGKEEGKGLQCECQKGIIVEQGKPAEPAGDEDKKTEDVKTLYWEVNGMYITLGGKDFIEFAAYVLCLDESEIAPSKLTVEQLKQIKAYIETSGVTIN